MSLTKVSFSMITGAYVNVLDLGADSTGVTDSYAAFEAAWNAVKTTGGVIYIPPGDYLLNSQWVCEISSFKNIKITGFGATLLAGPSVTGHAIKIYKSYNQTILDIEGLNFNHINNTTVGGCFLLSGAHCVHITSCNVEFFATKAGYSFALFESSVSGDPTYQCFWCSIEKCNTRTRSGSSPADYGIILSGAANATKIKQNQFTALNTAIYIKTDGLVASSYGLANAVIISENDFEDISSTAITVQGQSGYYGITGLRVMSNRVEICPTFFAYVTDSTANLQASMPPFLMANYCTTGSVTTWVYNPTNYYITTLEAMTPGFGPTVSNTFYMNAGIDFVFPTSYGVTTRNASGSATYNVGFLTQGAYRYWTNPGDGKFYVKAGTPTSATDGTVVGTQT